MYEEEEEEEDDGTTPTEGFGPNEKEGVIMGAVAALGKGMCTGTGAGASKRGLLSDKAGLVSKSSSAPY